MLTPPKELYPQVIVQSIIMWREVNRLHPLIKPVTGLELPLSESGPSSSCQSDYRGYHNDGDQSGLAQTRLGR